MRGVVRIVYYKLLVVIYKYFVSLHTKIVEKKGYYKSPGLFENGQKYFCPKLKNTKLSFFEKIFFKNFELL